MLTSLILNSTVETLELYLCQVSKSDLILYEDIKQTRAFADNLAKTYKMLQHIDKKMIERDEMIRPLRKKALADNYMDFNKLNPERQISTVYVFFDETSSLFQTKGDDKDTKKFKEDIVVLIRKISQYGAGLGVFLICSLQRPTADNMDTFVKSQSTCKISFRQNNNKSSEVALDDPDAAIGLEQREFCYFISTYKFGMVPLVKNKKIYEYIKPYVEKFHRDLFQDMEKLEKNQKVSKEKIEESSEIKISKEPITNDKKKKETPNKKVISVEFNHVNKTKSKEDILKENISKIPGYVPYKPITSEVTVIDKTKINNKTSKSIKQGRERIEE